MDHSPDKRLGVPVLPWHATKHQLWQHSRDSRQHLDEVSCARVAGESTSDKRPAIPEQLHVVASTGQRRIAEFGHVYSWASQRCSILSMRRLTVDCLHLTAVTNSWRALFTTLTSTGLVAPRKAILNGWTIAPIVNMFSGFRYTAVTNGFTPPAAVATGSTFGTSQAGGINGSNGSLRFGLTPNNAFHTPSIKYVDLRVSRRFTIE